MKKIYSLVALPDKKNKRPGRYAVMFILLFVVGPSSVLLAQTTQTFTTSGTWTCPAGVTSITVEAWGAGGGGGLGGSSNGKGGGGGGGGAYTKNVVVSVTPGTTYTITVGTGGSAGAAGSASTATFGATVVTANPGQGGASFASGGTGGAGGTAGTFSGGAGATQNSSGSGGGGGGAGSGGPGGTAGGGTGIGQAAGTGTAAGGGNGGAGTTANSGNGGNGNVYGGGGGGATKGGTPGSGANGQIAITYTCVAYSLSSTAATSVCTATATTVTLTSLALPVGNYTVNYSLSGANTGSGSAPMTVSTAGSGTFTTSALPNSGSTTITITSLVSGSGTGCTSTVNSNNAATIMVGATISGTLTVCPGSTTQLTGSGTPSGWSSANTSVATVDNSGKVTGVSPGTSLITYTEGGGCTGTATVTVQGISLTSATGTNNQSVCKAGNVISTITYSVTGATGASIVWSPSSPGVTTGYSSGTYTISGSTSGTAAGIYTYTITPTGSSCSGGSATGQIYVFSPGTITVVRAGGRCGVNIIGSAVTCGDGSSATYQWERKQPGDKNFTPISGQNGKDIFPDSTDVSRYKYQRVVSCGSCMDSVNENSPIASYMSVSATSTSVSCFGFSDGTATATITGGTAPYTYSWGGQTATGLAAGTYSVTVKDSFGCNTNATVVVSQPAVLSGNMSTGKNTLCQNSASPNITFTGSGGTTPYTFTYNINSGTPTNVNTAGATVNVPVSTTNAGTFIYNLTALTDAHGCTPAPAVSGADTFVVNPAPTAQFTGSTSIVNCYGSSVNLSITGTPNAQISYTKNGVAQPAITLDGSGNYTLATTITGSTTYTLTNVQNSTTFCTATPSAGATTTLSVTAGSYTWTGLVSSDWNVSGNWCSNTLPALASSVSIPAGTPHDPVISNANASAGSVVIASGATVTMTGVYNLNVASGGSFTNNGSFNATASTGAVIFAGSNTVDGSSTTTFNNVTSNGSLTLNTAPNINGTFTITGGAVSGNAPTYGSSSTLLYNTGAYTAGVEWNTGSASTTSAGAGIPQNVTIQAGTITIPNSGGANRALAGNLTIGAGTTLQITAGSRDLYILGNWVNNGGTFNANGRTVDFNLTSATSGTQTISGTTTFYDLTFGNSNITTDFQSSNVTVTDQFNNNAGTMVGGTSTVTLTGGTGAVIGSAAKNFYSLQVNSGAVITHTTGGGNIHIANSFVNNGSLTENTAYTFFFDKSNATETFSGTGSTSFGKLTIGGVGFSNATTLNCSSDFTVTGGNLNFLNSSIYNGSNNTATFSTNAATISGSGTANFYNAITNVALDPGSGISTINNTLTINTGGSVITNAPVYGSAATLIYNTTTPTYNTGLEWTGNSGSTGAGAPFNVTVQNANSVLESGPRTVPGTLNVSTGNSFDINSYTLTVNTAFSGGGDLRGSAASGLITSGTGTVHFSSAPYNQLLTLSVNTGGNLTLGGNIASGDTLNIVAGNAGSGYGTVTANGILNTGSLLALKSNANGTATVAASTGVINDTVTVERYFPAIRAWRFVAVPFSSTNQSINAAWQEGWVNSVLECPSQFTGTPGYGTEISGGSSANGYDINNTGYTSIQVYLNNNWVAPPSTYTNLLSTTFNRAYSLFVRGDRNVCLTDVLPPDITTLRPRGILNQRNNGADITVNMSGAKPGDFILIGNPYAAPLNIEPAVKSNNSGITPDQFWVWNPTLGGTNGVGGYVAFSGGLQVPQNSDTTNYAANTIIQSGEAFMVQVSSASASITFRENDKSSTENTTGVFGLMATKERHPHSPPALYVNLVDTSNMIADGVAVGFGNKYSTHTEAVDAPKKWNEEIENMVIVKHDTALAIDFRPMPKESDSVQLRLYLRQQPYALQIFTKGVKADLPAELWLVDKYLGTRTQLDIYHTNLYGFTPNKDTNSYRNRFMVVFNRTGNKQEDKGTKTTTIAGNDSGDRGAVSLYPNPVTGEGKMMLQFNNMPAGSYTATIYNAAGDQLSINTIQHTGGNTAYTLHVQPSWSSGVYNLRVINKDGNNVKNLTFILKR
jgi:hypothetical protein